jgi:hypothetical protein
MSKQKDSDDLVLVGPGTAMGELMRQYWIPAVMSSELERDGAPVRLMLLGEKLIASATARARSGLDCRCPHRCASLFLEPLRITAFAASITAGNTTRRIASTAQRAAASGLRTR